MGFRLGLYGGRQINVAPTDWMAWRTPAHLVRGEVVHHHDVACPQRQCELLSDIGQEQFSVHCSVDDQRRGQAVVTQRGDKGRRLPMAVRHLGDQPLTAPAATVTLRHVRAGPRLIQEHQATRIDADHLGLPGDATLVDVGTILFRGAQDFF